MQGAECGAASCGVWKGKGMETERRLYRSRDALAGGVCAGIADYFGVDAIVVRILTVILSLATTGLAAIAYVALWAVLPKAPEHPSPYEVTPQAVHSETYGDIDCARARQAADAAATTAAARMAAYGTYRGVGHVPPAPPAGARVSGVPGVPPVPSAGAPTCGSPAASVSASAAPPPCAPAAPIPPTNDPSTPSTPAMFRGAASGVQAPAQAPSAACAPARGVSAAGPAAPNPAPSVPSPATPPRHGGAKGALAFGILLLFCGVLALAGKFVMGAVWWQFWPLALVIAGIAQMAVPGERGRRASKFSGGFVVFCLGAALLPMSLGALSFDTVALAVANLWPLLVIMLGFLVLGGALKSPLFPLLAALAFAAFCAAGLAWFAVPGSTEYLVIEAPFGRQYVWDLAIGRSPETMIRSLCAAFGIL